jgi:hypothetical protein
MSPDDPRHGRSTGYRLGCRDQCCQAAVTAVVLRRRRRLYLEKIDSTVMSSLGAQRRIRALVALGWSMAQISREADYTRAAIGHVLRRDVIHRDTFDRVAAVYERLSMTLPPVVTKTDKNSFARSKNLAASNGWPPPLAWDDIDDPDEQPTDWAYTPSDRAELLAEFVDRGAGISEACRVLHTSREALQKWCGNNNLSHVYRVLASREHGAGGNQFSDQEVA